MLKKHEEEIIRKEEEVAVVKGELERLRKLEDGSLQAKEPMNSAPSDDSSTQCWICVKCGTQN